MIIGHCSQNSQTHIFLVFVVFIIHSLNVLAILYRIHVLRKYSSRELLKKKKKYIDDMCKANYLEIRTMRKINEELWKKKYKQKTKKQKQICLQRKSFRIWWVCVNIKQSNLRCEWLNSFIYWKSFVFTDTLRGRTSICPYFFLFRLIYATVLGIN